MARPASPPRPCRDRTVSKATLPGRACTDKVDRRTRAFRAWENAMVFLGIDVSEGRLDYGVRAPAPCHEPVAHRLAALGMRVSIVNPAQVRSFAKGIGV